MKLNILAVYVLLLSAVVVSEKPLLNEKVMTIIDISSQLVKVSDRITIVNEQSKPVTSYLYIVDPLRKNNLSFIKAEDDRGNSLYVNQVTTHDSSVRFEISFKKALFPDNTATIEVLTVFVNCLQSYPKSIRQHENHLVLFTFNVYYYSLYFTELQTLVLNAGAIGVNTLSGDTYKLGNNSKDGLQYGPFHDKKSESVYHTSIHYESNSHFLVVENLDRFIKISHWGYLNVWDKVSLIHAGPMLKGPFERSVSDDKGDTRIDSFVASLPEDAFDIYLKDEIGLISSFSLHFNNPNSVDVHIKPRFVLYGGWKIQFEIGYSLPIKYYVSYDKHNQHLYKLIIPLVNSLYPNMFIRKAKVNVMLPERARYQDISPYYDIENNTESKHCYVMDVTCREVVAFNVYNLVNHHSTTNFQLTYSFAQINLLTKPLVFSAFIYTFFLSFLIYIYFIASNSSSTRETNRSSTYVNPSTPATLSKEVKTTQMPAKKEGIQKKPPIKTRVKSKKH